MSSLPPFTNAPVMELRRRGARETLTDALAELDSRLPLRVPVLIGGERGTATGLQSTDPGLPSRLVAEAGRAGEE
ncbi:MAG: hypothetical protein ACRDSN_21130, partial [Pseudonocardiaceae bacterium]